MTKPRKASAVFSSSIRSVKNSIKWCRIITLGLIMGKQYSEKRLGILYMLSCIPQWKALGNSKTTVTKISHLQSGGNLWPVKSLRSGPTG